MLVADHFGHEQTVSRAGPLGRYGEVIYQPAAVDTRIRSASVMASSTSWVTKRTVRGGPLVALGPERQQHIVELMARHIVERTERLVEHQYSARRWRILRPPRPASASRPTVRAATRGRHAIDPLAPDRRRPPPGAPPWADPGSADRTRRCRLPASRGTRCPSGKPCRVRDRDQ